MRNIQYATAAIVLCLALAGVATADDVDASTRLRGPTAWAFIESRPELRNIALILDYAGYRNTLSGSFRGTLLLPTNDAVLAYTSRMQYNAADVTFNAVIRTFWETIASYHVLPRAASTKQWRSVTLDTKHPLEPSSTRATQRTSGRQPTGRYHTVTFVRDRNNWVHPRSDNASTNTLGRRTVSAVRDEQGNSVTFASTNNPVLGGGLVHVVNALLQPDDVFPSMSALLDSRPDLSIISSVIQQLNLTTIWPNNCVWVSDEVCYANGGSEDFYNVTLQSVNHTCLPCWESSYGCASPNFCGELTNKFPEDFYGTNYCPGGCTFASGSSPGRRHLASHRGLLQNGGRPANQAGTRAFEGFAGTLALPNNGSFRGITLSLDPFRASEWTPVAQFHFIAAARPPAPITSSELVRFDSRVAGGFGRNNRRRNFLGQMRNDPQYVLTFSSSGSGCTQPPCLSISYPRRGQETLDIANFVPRGENLNRPGTNIQTPGHFYHIIDKIMEPPCGTDAECNRPFRRQPRGA